MSTALFIYILSSIARSGIVILIVMTIGSNSADAEKLSSYECGYEPSGNSRETFDVGFYRVGRMFLIFDVEIAFLFPWSILVLEGPKSLIWLILAFSFILIAGFVLEMKIGVLDWKLKFSLSLLWLHCSIKKPVHALTI
jgi:NADH-quinone oxidoreductase subunit A